MRREIFIGSSTEGLVEAERVCNILSEAQDQEIKCVLWNEVFQPGFFTFEALEIVLLRCCGAVFVAGPDDQTTIRGRAVNSPRANIMLEFGLMAGRMGRHNIALWKYGTVELPSDLEGLTVISVDKADPNADPNLVPLPTKQKLLNWSAHLSATGDGVPRTEVVHGYTGTWDFEINLRKWRNVSITPPDYVMVKGYLNLIMPSDGQTGRGLAHGRLLFKITMADSRVYEGRYHTSHGITNALCEKDGSLILTTEAFAIQRITAVGDPPPQLAGIEFCPEPWTARWVLAPLEGPRTLGGDVRSEGVVDTQGLAKLLKSSEAL